MDLISKAYFTYIVYSNLLPFLGLVKKVFWGILVFGCFVALFTHITIIAIQYGSYKASASVQITSERELPFPSVTFCNMNPLKKSALSKPGLPDALVNTGTSRKKRSTKSLIKDQHFRHPEIPRHKVKKSLCYLSTLLQIPNEQACRNIENAKGGIMVNFVDANGNARKDKYQMSVSQNVRPSWYGKGIGTRTRKKRAGRLVI